MFFGDYSARPKIQDGIIANGEASNSKKKFTSIDDILQGLVEWLCAQVCIHLWIGTVGLMSTFYLMNGYFSILVVVGYFCIDTCLGFSVPL